MPQDLKETLNLPETDFPMRASLVQREPERITHWNKIDLYARIQKARSEASPYILHDGPPFTNGDVHIGTALNKTLKDIILRFKSMRGHATPYVPGWDCHGLPIEHKVTKDRQKSGESLEPKDVRAACADFSASFIEKMRVQFSRLGILADWEAEYRTMNPAYEADILRTFAAFVEQGLVYRSKKPVYWSIPCQTALAEAEIEYRDHVSPSIWVAFQLEAENKLGGPAEIVIWTTTPWTLPANLAVAVHPNLTYRCVKQGERRFLVAEALLEDFCKRLDLDPATAAEDRSIQGSELEGIKAQHPFIDRPSPIVLADYVTTESGTGCVHTAPGHGLDDYLTGLKYGLEIYCPLDDCGVYLDDGQVPAELVGLSVHEVNGKSKANEAVLEIIKGNGSLLHLERYSHQYPHCWRSKSPVIFRAMDQWFVSLDKEGTREKALEAISQVSWEPSWGENRIRGALETRPDWCISRQRSWGVPIPVFVDAENERYLLDADVIRALADKVQEQGTDLWFEQEAEALLKGIDLPEGWDPSKLQKGQDTLDVWIDSGCSHRAVLQRRDNLQWPADLYLEGSDQHRGWFQSSLWTGIIADGKPPYKQILTHGFIVNENKKKISKSEGKPQTADSYIKQYGADILRLWIASVDYRHDIPVSEKILKQVVNTYRTIRNTLKFQLGNLADFDRARDGVAINEMTPIDRWALQQTYHFHQKVQEAYEQLEFHRVYQLVATFCNETLSATYHDILKDRLYTFGPDWKERRSAQTVIHHQFNLLVRVLAPVLSFTTDEAFSYASEGQALMDGSIHLEDWPEPDSSWCSEEVSKDIDALLAIRDRVNEQLEAARREKTIAQSLDAQVRLETAADSPEAALLERYEAELPELFIVSAVTHESGAASFTVVVSHADGQRCPRSWRWVPELIELEGYGAVSPRCREALLDREKLVTP